MARKKKPSPAFAALRRLDLDSLATLDEWLACEQVHVETGRKKCVRGYKLTNVESLRANAQFYRNSVAAIKRLRHFVGLAMTMALAERGS